MRTAPSRWAICGCGSAGGALAAALAAAGEEVLVWDRRPARARYLARRERIRATVSLGRLLQGRGTLLLAVSDSALGEFAARLSRERISGPRREVALHLAGALGRGLLAPLSHHLGMATGVFHPVVSLRGPRSAGLLQGASATISGEPAALAASRRLARRLGLHALGVEDSARPLVHLAAVMAAGDLIALTGLAEELLVRAGIAPEQARRLLGHLSRSALSHWEDAGVGQAVTGPAARGDLKTLESHLGAARGMRRERELGLLHRLLVLEGARAAMEAGRLGQDRWRELQSSFGATKFAGNEEPP